MSEATSIGATGVMALLALRGAYFAVPAPRAGGR